MMIGIEASRANKPIKTGVEWYAWHVIQELKKLTEGDGHSWLLFANDMLRGGLEKMPSNWFERRISWLLPYGWTQARLSWEMWRRPTDVLFLPCSTMPRVVPPKTVVTLHDIGFHRYPQLYKPRQVIIHERAMREAARRAARIITVSEFSAQEIVEAYGIPRERIFVTYNGLDHSIYRPMPDLSAVQERLNRYRLLTPYFIAVGRLEAKKNILTLIKAFNHFKHLRGIGDPHRLVLVGVSGYGYDDIKRAIAQSPARAHILELGYVPELDLPALLNAAEALIHPAWYEGFGLPPLQAMACGCPVLSSNAASLPEVIGENNALFFSLGEPDKLVDAMMRIVSEPGLRDTLRAAGAVRATRYTWAETAKRTLPILTEW